MTTLGLEYLKHKENSRANLAKEAENFRSNRARERETARHNVVTEGQKYADISLSSQTLAETARSNQAREAEAQRASLAKEKLNEIKELGETSDLAGLMAYDREYDLTVPEKIAGYADVAINKLREAKRESSRSQTSSLSNLGAIINLVGALA